MRHALPLSILLLILASCGDMTKGDNPEETKIENAATGVNYKILNETVNDSISKIVLEIEIPEKLSEKQLTKIANELHEPREKYNRVWMFYYLPTMKTGSGAWATTHFDPKMKVEFLGSTLKEEETANQDANTVDGDIIGKWKEEQYLSSTIVFYKKDDSIFGKTIFKNGQEMVDELVAKKTKTGTRYETKGGDAHGEYYVVEKDGNLGFYNKENKRFTIGIKVN